jgi:hypothetical protein
VKTVRNILVSMRHFSFPPEIFLGAKSGRRVGLTTLPPSMSRMSENVGASTSRNPKGLRGLYRDNFTYLRYIFVCLYCVLIGSGIAHGLDDPGSIPGMKRCFSSLHLSDRLWGSPSLYPMGIGGHFLGDTAAGAPS